MREAYLEECRRHDYMISPTASRTSVLQGIENLCEDDVIDKSTVATLTSAIQESLGTTDQQISQLCQQLKGQLFTKGFLIRVSAVLCSTSVNVTETHITGLNRQVEEINKALLAIVSKENLQFCSPGQDCESRCSISNDKPGVSSSVSDSNNKSDVHNGSVTGRNKVKPVAAVRSNLCKSSPSFSGPSGAVKSAQIRPRSDVNPTKFDPTKVKEQTVGSFYESLPKSGHNAIANPCSEDLKTSPYLPQNCENSVECGNTAQMNDGSEDEEESPYDNVITLQEYLSSTSTMFRRKKSNASRTDLERSNTLSSKDNFLAVTSKHVAPSNIPRSQESTTQSPHLGRHFQMLKMTTGFDFVLDDNATDTQQLNESSEARNNSSKSDNHPKNNIVDSHASAGGVSTAVDPKIAEAKNRLSSHDELNLDVNISSDTLCASAPQGMPDHDKSDEKDKGERALTNVDQDSHAPASVITVSNPQATIIGPENEKERTDSPRLTPSAPPACEVLTSTAQTKTSARSHTLQTVTVSATATSAWTPVVARNPAGEDKTSAGLPVVDLAGSSPTPGKTMDAPQRHPSIPLRSPPTSRGGVSSVPPPVAKKPVSYGSGKAPPPVPRVKPVLKPSQSAHAQLSNSTVDHTATTSFNKIDENSDSNKDFGSPRSHSSPVTSPFISKSPNPVGTAPKLGALASERKGSVNGIAELFGGRNISQSVQNSYVNSSDKVNKTNRKSRDYTPSPPVPARKRASGTINSLGEDTDPQKTTYSQVEKEETCSKLNRDNDKCVTEKSEEEHNLPAIQTACRHSVLAADAVAWPKGLDHPELKCSANGEESDSKAEQSGESGGIGELVGRTHSSLIFIHGRLHRGGTVATDTEDTSLPTDTQTEQRSPAAHDLGSVVKGSEDKFRKTPEETSSSSRIYSQDSVDTLVNPEEYEEDRRPSLDRSVSFTSDQDVKEAIFCLDAIIKSEPMERNPSLRLSSASTTSSVGSNSRPLSTPTSPIPLRRQQELGVSNVSTSSRRKSSTASYENWTINRAVTRLITSATDFDFGSEEDEEEQDAEEEVDDGVSEGVASPFPMKRDVPAKGSNDSGLCDDISVTSESGHMTTTGSSTDGGVVDLVEGKIRDLKTLKLMTECAEEDEDEMEGGGGILDTHRRKFHSHREKHDQDMDSICEYALPMYLINAISLLMLFTLPGFVTCIIHECALHC
ncbi:hypothetical protein ElyMa_000779900 [Elysia marginata]|uniref:Uncharacterized protein n=1 Tax=Elysia marginata TaxID=1093978 RepID=A0AAV4GW50_9GAST|nr:hypothetical protein ElyMa_000779900 [Elysia marginata]